MTYTSRFDLIASFSSHSSVKGNCIQQWFRLHDDGSKDELIADGQCTLSFFLRLARYQIQFFSVGAELMFNCLSLLRMSRSCSS